MKQRSASRIVWLVALANLFGAFIPLGAQTNGFVLSSASVSTNGITFTVNAEAGVNYTIQTSSNLVDWVSVITNSDPGILRTIAITNLPDCQNYYRAGRAPLPLFTGLTAKGTISLSGGAYVDSFDSSDTNYSNPDGTYNAALRKDNAIVLSDSNATNAISLSTTNCYIAGSVVTGPGGAVATTNSARVGDNAWIASGNIGIQPNHSQNDANRYINDIAALTFSGFSTTLPGSGTVNGTNYTYVFTNGNYKLIALNLSGAQKMVVNGNVTVYCTSTGNNVVNVSGAGFIYILPGSSLTIYSAGNIIISGFGIVNGTQNANNCFIYGLPTCTAMSYSGAAAFYGVVNVPEANFTLSGPQGLVGAIIANAVNISGSGGVHFDESLARFGPTR